VWLGPEFGFLTRMGFCAQMAGIIFAIWEKPMISRFVS
jgi:hypothetical protein